MGPELLYNYSSKSLAIVKYTSVVFVIYMMFIIQVLNTGSTAVSNYYAAATRTARNSYGMASSEERWRRRMCMRNSYAAHTIPRSCPSIYIFWRFLG